MSNVERLSGELQRQIRGFQEQLISNIPPEIASKLVSTTEALVRSGIAEKALQEGAEAPDFVLKNQRRKPVSLSERFSLGPAVLTFYRGGW